MKGLGGKLKETLDDAVKLLNYIKSRLKQSRIFTILSDEMGSEHSHLLLHCKVRWLSRGRVLTRLYELKDELGIFLTDNDCEKTLVAKFLASLNNKFWLLRLAYLSDVFSYYLNALNVSLQGKDNHKYYLQDKIEATIKKIASWGTKVDENYFDSFSTMHNFMGSHDVTVDEETATTVKEHFSSLVSNLSMEGFQKATSVLINGKVYAVPDNLPSNTSLNEFIRNYAYLKGTKNTCREGGCGACIVAVKSKHPCTGEHLEYGVNSCLVPVFLCADWQITTVEGIGSRTMGYHDVQARLAKGNGTQCGYCSVGMVMNMYSLMKTKPDLTMEEIENSFGGNLCRCTGYRPILDSFKSFAKDAPKALIDKCADIEDLITICPVKKKLCVRNGTCDLQNCDNEEGAVNMRGETPRLISLQDGSCWYYPRDKKEIFAILERCSNTDYMFVGGNTAHGVYRISLPIKHYISLNGVEELHRIVETRDAITLGASNSLTATMEYFYRKSEQQPQMFGYLKELAHHIDLIANVPVRNTGTLAGNLAIKNQHKEFPSDLFVMLETVRAKIVVEDVSHQETILNVADFINFDMTKKLIIKIIMPSINSEQYVCKTFKVMPRAQNAHAYVNAGFLFKVDKKDKFKVLEKPNIVFGGISPEFVHASTTEFELVGKQLLSSATLDTVLGKLKSELKAEQVKPDASVEYREGLACSLFYKFILGLSPEDVNKHVRSGGEILKRPISSGHQEVTTDKSIWPVSKPIPKIEALAQCSGEAEYVNDIENLPNQLYGAFIVATQGPADSFTLDASEALKLPGVVALHTAKDIPGKNSYLYPVPAMGAALDEPIYADKVIPCAGMTLGAIFAETQAMALHAASLVKVTYCGLKEPQIDVKKIVESGDQSRLWLAAEKKADAIKTDVQHIIEGTHWFPPQYHFTMETQTCYSVPSEDGLDVYPATQAPSCIQDAIAYALDLPHKNINVSVRRIGGGYGGKLLKSGITAVASALAAHLLQRPVRMVMTLEENMEIVGKRAGVLFKYKVGVDDDGVVQNLHVDYYQDDGASKNDSVAPYTQYFMTSGIYDSATWSINCYGVKTDLPSQTWCRAPGSTEGISAVETIMEHIAHTIKRDPTQVKMANRKQDDSPIPSLIEDFKKTCDFDKRTKAIEEFNKMNRWRKRGISLVPMNYPFSYFGNYHSMVSVYGNDGSVAVSHGCIEMGQGLNTKVAQVCAYVLGIDVQSVSIKPYYSIIAPNVAPTGGSVGSESVVYATKIACEEIKKRLAPLMNEKPKATWKEIITEAKAKKINLNASYMFTPNDDVKSYNIYGVSVIEVEVDILTGQHLVLRADILEDTGVSLSPEVDIGQIEGAYVMGLGLYTSEELQYEDTTGRLLTNRTWNYKIPGAKDIPVDFRVEMRKNAPNPVGVLKSKATGEPPLCMSIGVVFALRKALVSARTDAGIPDKHFDIELPLTTERIWLYGGACVGRFLL